ncbi:AAA family ATPase [Pontibacillus halophilus]|nr:AAA family ATPase [Pontibacillus halophilus]
MKFVMITGPQAVGKMTVGQELAKLTNLSLFHNHMTIDLVGQFFDYDTPSGKRLVNLFRHEIFEEMASSDEEGMIFTYVWAFNLQEDWEYVERVTHQFESKGATVYYVELEANLDTRLQRNKTENRLQHKPSKRDIQWSENEMKDSMNEYRLNSIAGEITHTNYIRIDNTNLSAREVAEKVKDAFTL